MDIKSIVNKIGPVVLGILLGIAAGYGYNLQPDCPECEVCVTCECANCEETVCPPTSDGGSVGIGESIAVPVDVGDGV